jgi:transcriptional regulator with XRE-family HTH domain
MNDDARTIVWYSERMELRRRVGEAIKHAREARGISLSDLARQSGTAKATLSALEAGRANPTLETLWALAAALKLSLGELVDPPSPGLAQHSVLRAGEGTVVRGDAVVGRIVQSFESGPNRIEIYDAHVLNRRQISPAHARGVVEHLVVTRGRLRVGPVDDPVELRPGDYLRMAPSWPHLYQGLERDTHMVLVMQFPGA